MKKVIRAFKRLDKSLQNEVYVDYSEGLLERTQFPYNGGLEEGVIFQTEDCMYLIPVSSIIEVKSAAGEDLEEEESRSETFDEEEISDEE